jgi:WD40 repeat protein
MNRTTNLARLLAASFIAALLAPVLVYAEHTRFWRQTDYAEFDRGTAKGVALRSDGKLLPAPKFAAFSDPNMAYLWALCLDSKGRLYAAGGSDAKVLRFDDAGKPTTLFESSELAAQAIVFDSHDNLYVGTSPDGKVYKVTPDGTKTVLFEPPTKYIWGLAFDSQGDLFIGTGDKGEVFVLPAGGKGQLFYQSDERHARSLAFDSKGNLLIGTDPDGLIIRVEIARKGSQPQAGASFVVYETNKKEVTSLVSAADGTLYAAAIGEKQRGASPAPVAPSFPVVQPQTPTPAITSQGTTITLQATSPQPVFPYPLLPSATGGSEVIRISPDGSPESLWTSRDDLVFAMNQSPAGKLLLGTGNHGAVIEIESQNLFSSGAKTAAAQVTSLLPGPGGKIFAATANPGKIFTLGPGFESQGSFESDTFDAKIFSHWGRLTWWGENGANDGKVAFYVRSGNTSSPEKNWSPWAGPYTSAAGQTISCPPARFAQWKAVFLDTDHGAVPSISWVSLAYQPKNVAPVIDDVTIQDPGIRVQGFGPQPGTPGNPAPVQLRMPQHPGASFPLISNASKVDVPPQGFTDRQYQSVLWSVHDDNDDDLLFSVYYRGENEHNWRLLKDKLSQHFYSWDTSTMPDGAYYLKIVASDSPSNPLGSALSAERESDRFEIANTPPHIDHLRAVQGSPTVHVAFDAIASSGAIAHAQYSLDAGDWQVVFPVGLLSDATQEKYEFQLEGLAPGEHTVAVQVQDRYDNSTSAKVTFTVRPSK